ncbi:hypothetical protein BVRB_033650, partial [Beta vulgaris subsp. vulgaris]
FNFNAFDFDLLRAVQVEAAMLWCHIRLILPGFGVEVWIGIMGDGRQDSNSCDPTAGWIDVGRDSLMKNLPITNGAQDTRHQDPDRE